LRGIIIIWWIGVVAILDDGTSQLKK